MRCRETNPYRRYETASALAADVQRYLHDEPVQACPPSAAYRIRKFARRNKGDLTTVALVSGALVLTVIVLSGSLGRINHEKNQKDQALKQARANEKEGQARDKHADENFK